MNEAEDNALSDEAAGLIEAAYLDQIDDVVQQTVVADVERAVERNDVLGILGLLVGLSGFLRLTEAIRGTYNRAAVLQMASFSPADVARAEQSTILPGYVGPVATPAPTWQAPLPQYEPSRQRIQFTATPRQLPPYDPRLPAVDGAVNRIASEIVQDVQQAQVDAVAVVLDAGRAQGRTSREIALDIVGRKQVGGRRQGGAIGIGGGDALALTNARAQLAGANPAELRQYLRRVLRDRRFDRSVEKAIKTGKPVPQSTVDKMITQYSNRLLRHRAAVLAQVAAKESVGAGRMRAVEQLIEQGVLSSANPTKVWHSQRDERVRNSHRALDGQVVGLRQAFTAPSGAQLLYPCDTSLGAPYSETAGCRCHFEIRL